jgi:glycerol-1-phosphate dehydrogenase [NAD(P)+]
MPLLARMLAAPLFIEVRPGAVASLGGLLADWLIARDGRVAIAVGPGQGDSICDELQIDAAEVHRIPAGSYAASVALGQRLRSGRFEAVAGIGGGKTIDVTKFAAHMAGIPMVAVTTSLGHDGIASPISTLENEAGTDSYGVVMPAAVIVDLDRVRHAPASLSTAGVGDAISDLSAVADWELAAADVGEQVDGLAVAMARSAAQAVLHQPGPARSDEFLTVLAESLILSGMAMAVAGSSRPASGGDHEIMHAINQLYPGTASHGELAGVGALFCAHLRGDLGQAELISACLSRHGLPRTPADLGLSTPEFVKAVAYAPQTRPDRYTILERLALSEPEITDRVEAYAKDIAG